MNKVTLIGNVLNDLKLRKYKNGEESKSYVNFTLAVNDYSRKTNEKIITFVEVFAFNRQAEILAQYISKGSKLAIDGKLRPKSYVNRKGQKRNTVHISVEDFTVLEKNKRLVNQ